LQRALEDASWFHGRDGMGDHNYPAPRKTVESMNAADAIIATAQAHPGLVLVTLGPLTNLALALQRQPDLAKWISRCVVMGGAPCCEGNVTPAAEFNIWCDPEAAHIVVRGGLPLELVGWHLCRGSAVLGVTDIARVRALETPLSHFAIECNSTAQAAFLEQTGEHGISLPDPVAMAIALDPTIVVNSSDHWVDVETNSTLTRGMTVVDRLNVADNARNRLIWKDLIVRPANARIHWSIDANHLKALLFESLAH
jgi:purine nucleosidase